MKPCECCGNTYDKAFEITVGGETLSFDSFACATHTLAPHCAHCGVAIIAHGMETGDAFYCCAHCARHPGFSALQDRA